MAERKKRKSSKSVKLEIPKRIFAQVSPKSIGGVSLFESSDIVEAQSVANFFSDDNLVSSAAYRLQQAGFEVLQVTASSINIAGSKSTYEQAFNTTLFAEERPVIKPVVGETVATFIDSPSADRPGLISTQGSSFSDILEGVALEDPYYFMAPNKFAPSVGYWHLDVPGDVSLGVNADRAHRTGITGKGIKVAMVDSGHYRHPFFTSRGYRVRPVTLAPGTANPLHDESGHGTGESANIFAVAPDVDFYPVKMSFVNTTAAFNTAVALRPHIITCSWGSSNRFGPLTAGNITLGAAIAAAVRSGIVVVFSAGNGHWGYPGQHPNVISAGGAFIDSGGAIQASDYSSGFMSNIYPNRRVPDLTGLVGMRSPDGNSPGAMYIMLPLEPKDKIDQGNSNSGANHYRSAGATAPWGDETTDKDGWAVFSGTSAAAPQLAGVAALIKQSCFKLSPWHVRDIMKRTARDVTAGNCHPNTGGNAAVAGPDTATGHGLANAYLAVLVAKIRCFGFVTPILPTPPVVPPIPPIITQPPADALFQSAPTDVMQNRIEYLGPDSAPPEQSQSGLSAEDIEALENMVLNSNPDDD